MHAISLASEVYLVYVLGIMPWLAFRSAKVFQRLTAPGTDRLGFMPSRSRMYVNTIAMLVLLFVFAWYAGGTFGYAIFALPHLGARDLLYGVSALAFTIALILVNRAFRTAEEIAAMPVNRLMPQTSRERVLWAITSFVAGISEEAVYRGVLTAILWHALGNQWLAAAISAAAFAVSHLVQGWRSVAVVFVLALAMQELVWATETLVVAMAVHTIYDLVAPAIRRRIPYRPPYTVALTSHNFGKNF